MSTTARDVPGWNQAPGISSGLSLAAMGLNYLQDPSQLSQTHQHGAGLKVKQSRHEPALKLVAGMVGGDVLHNACSNF